MMARNARSTCPAVIVGTRRGCVSWLRRSIADKSSPHAGAVRSSGARPNFWCKNKILSSSLYIRNPLNRNSPCSSLSSFSRSMPLSASDRSLRTRAKSSAMPFTWASRAQNPNISAACKYAAAPDASAPPVAFSKNRFASSKRDDANSSMFPAAMKNYRFRDATFATSSWACLA